jgi:hypothetical protein
MRRVLRTRRRVTRFTSASVHLACRVILVNKYCLPRAIARRSARAATVAEALKRLVGYDNERGKGDHRHIEDRQERYEFKTVELILTAWIARIIA